MVAQRSRVGQSGAAASLGRLLENKLQGMPLKTALCSRVALVYVTLPHWYVWL